MAGFIIGIILAVLALAAIGTALALGHQARGAQGINVTVARLWAWAAGGVLLVAAVILIIASTFVSIGTQDVGILLTYGRPSGDLPNGAHWKSPWQGVVTMYDGIITDTFEGNSCINIRVADQQTACANVRIRWQIRQAAADLLYRQYKTTTGVRESLVTGELASAMNGQFDTYNPIQSLTTTAAVGSAANPTIAQIGTRVLNQMRHEIGGQVKVYSVIVPLITYDSAVQNRINSVLAQAAQNDVSALSVKGAHLQAQAAAQLKAALAGNPQYLANRCLDVTVEAMKAGYQLPATWNCTGTGASATVLAGGHP